MKNKRWGVLLGLEAVLCVLFSVSEVSAAGAFTAAVTFPFEQLGLGLRALSLSGAAGNVLAILLYALLSLSPLCFLLFRVYKKKAKGEDALLLLLAGLLFAVLYLMVNPGDIQSLFGKALGIGAYKMVLGSTVYSVLFGYIVLRVLRLFFISGTAKLQRYLTVLLQLVNVLFVAVIFGSCFGKMLTSFQSLIAGNQGSEQLLGMSYVFLVLQFLADSIPYGLDVWIVFAALRLMAALGEDRYSETAVSQTQKLSHLCRLALIITTLLQVAFNLLQLLFGGKLMVINTQIQIPVLSVLFVLVVLLLSRYLAESKRLKDDNDSFI